jgi:hypothetical protein
MNPLGQRESMAIPGMDANLIWKKEPRYDSFLMPAGAAPAVIPFFQVPRGAFGSGFGAVVAKTASETNMSSPGSLGDPNQFLLYGFSFEVKPNIAAALAVSTQASDWALIYHTAVFRFILGANDIQLEIPLTKIPTGIGLTGFGATSVGATPLAMSSMTNGVPSASHYCNFTVPGSKLPLLIRGSQPFRCEIGYPLGAVTLLTITMVRVIMHGVYGSEQ